MKTSKDKFSITALLLTFFGVLFVGVVIVGGILFFNAKTIVVPSDGITTIQQAVDQANPGDIILVKESGGPYEEEVTIGKENIKLIGIGKVKPVLDGTSFVFADGITIDNTSGVLVKNFMTRNFNGHGIFLDSSDSNIIKENNFNNTNNQGIQLDNSDSNTIKRNNVNENSTQGIVLNGSTSNMIIRNNINENVTQGIRLEFFFESSDSNMIIGNTINDNGNDGIFLSADSNNNDVFFNRSFGNGFFDIEDLDVNNFKGNKCDTSDPDGICN